MSVKTSKEYEEAIGLLNKKYGKNTVDIVTRMSDVDTKRISTGQIALDESLGGGFPAGGFVEIYGPESSGKTTLCIQTCARYQRDNPDKIVAIIDHEHALDLDYAESLGLDLDRLSFSQPENGEEGFDVLKRLIAVDIVGIIVVDSIAAMQPKIVVDGEVTDSNVGVHARFMSNVIKKTNSISKKSETCVIWINQLREKIGVMFGSPEVTTGGNSMKFYAKIRLDIRRGQLIKAKDEDKEAIGANSTIKSAKNKLGRPHRKVAITMMFGDGFVEEYQVLHMAIARGLIMQSGSWYSANDTKIAQGEHSAVQFMMDNPDWTEEIRELIKATPLLPKEPKKKKSKKED